MTDPAPDPRWHWRNCRNLDLSLVLNVWPWRFGAAREDDVYGGRCWLALGPLSVEVAYGTGNVSTDRGDPFSRFYAATSLSDFEAYGRAARLEGLEP